MPDGTSEINNLHTLPGWSGKLGTSQRRWNSAPLTPEDATGASDSAGDPPEAAGPGARRPPRGPNRQNVALGGKTGDAGMDPKRRLPLLIKGSYVWLSNLYSVRNNIIINSSPSVAKIRENIG